MYAHFSAFFMGITVYGVFGRSEDVLLGENIVIFEYLNTIFSSSSPSPLFITVSTRFTTNSLLLAHTSQIALIRSPRSKHNNEITYGIIKSGCVGIPLRIKW
jgi:hypothetical protein